MKLIHRGLVAVLALTGLLPSAASAQIFLASKAHPDFAVGPLFLIANVRPDLSVTVNLSFSLTLRKGAARAAMEQDLFLLWPAEVAEPSAPGPADPTLASDIHDGLVVLNSGRLVLRSRDRTLVGTGQLGEALPEVASYVTVTRRGPLGSQISPVTYIKIPWTPKLADPLAVTTLVRPLRGLVTPKPASWIAETFWGRRWILTTGFGDLGSPVMPLYSIYFDHRDRVVRLAREFSQVIASFSDSDHLLIDGIEPATATRRPSRIRAGSGVVALVLTPMDGIAPQNLQVQFSYFSGRIAWRPIVVSLALLLLTNVAGAVMFGREMFGVVRARRRARAAAGRLSAEWLTGDAQAAALVGAATYDDIVARWGPPDEDRERLSTPGRRTMVYRAQKNGHAHQVEIEIADGRVTDGVRSHNMTSDLNEKVMPLRGQSLGVLSGALLDACRVRRPPPPRSRPQTSGPALASRPASTRRCEALSPHESGAALPRGSQQPKRSQEDPEHALPSAYRPARSRPCTASSVTPCLPQARLLQYRVQRPRRHVQARPIFLQ